MRAWLTHPIAAGVLFFVVANVPLWIGFWWMRRRQRVERQVWAMERVIWDEQRSPEEIEWDRQAKVRAAGVRREARRRLGLPEDRGDA